MRPPCPLAAALVLAATAPAAAWTPAGRVAGSERLMHPGGAAAAAFTPDGRRLVTAGRGLFAWSLPDGDAVGFCPTGAPFATTVDISPDGHLAAWSTSAPEAPALVLCDLASGATLRTWPLRGGAEGVAFSSDGTRLTVRSSYFTGGSGRGDWVELLLVADTATGAVLRDEPGAPRARLLGPDLRREVTLVERAELQPWVPGQPCTWQDTLTRHSLWVSDGGQRRLLTADASARIRLSTDGRLVAATHSDTCALPVFALDAERSWRLRGDVCGFEDVAFSPDGRFVVAWAPGHESVWDLDGDTSRPQRVSERAGGPSEDRARLTPVAGGELIDASLHPERETTRRDLRTGRTLERLGGPDALLGASRDGALAALRPGRDAGVDVRRFPGGSSYDPRGHASRGAIRALASSPDGAIVAWVDADRVLWLTPAAAGGPEVAVLELSPGEDGAPRVGFSDDGHTLVATAGLDVTVVDVVSRVAVRTVRAPRRDAGRGGGESPRAAYLPAGGREVWFDTFGPRPSLSRWSLATGQRLGRLKAPSRRREAKIVSRDDYSLAIAALAPDGRTLVTRGDDHRVAVWDASTGLVSHRLRAADGLPSRVAIAPDGHRVLGAAAGTATLWALPSGRTLSRTTRDAEVTCLAFDPAAREAFVGAADGSLRMLDAASGAIREEHTLPGHDWATSLAFSPDGATLLVGTARGLVTRFVRGVP